LSVCVSLLGRFAYPLHVFCFVLRNAFAIDVQIAQVVLATRVPLRSGFLIPLPYRRRVLRNTSSLVIQHTEVELALGIALLIQRGPFTQRGCVVAAFIGIHPRFKIGPRWSNETRDRQRIGVLWADQSRNV